MKRHRSPTDFSLFAELQTFHPSFRTQADLKKGFGRLGAKVGFVPRPGMIAVGVSDQGPIHLTPRIYVKVARRTIETFWAHLKNLLIHDNFTDGLPFWGESSEWLSEDPFVA